MQDSNFNNRNRITFAKKQELLELWKDNNYPI